ncbi:MAG TPA: ATP-binding cassette domain-containing protein [Verrucomicrobiae bacterium]|nr:ATP-binding cassette domain-containing protein [Verrucomicrobiae bacterium]
MQAATPDNVLVRVRGLSFSYGPRRVLDGLDLDIRRGRVTAIIGPSGSGKSTLLGLLGGQLRPDAGTVHVDGTDVHALSRKDLYQLRKGMGMMFQRHALLTDLTVFDNIAFPLREHTDLTEPMIRDIVLMKLQVIGLRGSRDLYPEQLSGGMMRRVALARAIALDPELVMYDEPFAGLDPITLGVLMKLIRMLNDNLGLTAIVVSHSVEEVLAVADDVCVLADGKVQLRGTPDEIRGSTEEHVQQFLTGREQGPVSFHYPAPPVEDDYLKRRGRAGTF